MPTPSIPFSCPAEREYFERHGAAAHARIAGLIALSNDLSEKAYQRASKRSGGYGCNCDEGSPCFEHRAAHRLVSIVESRGAR